MNLDKLCNSPKPLVSPVENRNNSIYLTVFCWEKSTQLGTCLSQCRCSINMSHTPSPSPCPELPLHKCLGEKRGRKDSASPSPAQFEGILDLQLGNLQSTASGQRSPEQTCAPQRSVSRVNERRVLLHMVRQCLLFELEWTSKHMVHTLNKTRDISSSAVFIM